MAYLQDNDYDTDDEYTKFFTREIPTDREYNEKISIINYYKNLLSYEPEFIGIKNINAGLILKIIDITRKPLRLNKKDYKLNSEQWDIFNKMYYDLELEGYSNLYNTVTKKIFNKIYIII